MMAQAMINSEMELEEEDAASQASMSEEIMETTSRTSPFRTGVHAPLKLETARHYMDTCQQPTNVVPFIPKAGELYYFDNLSKITQEVQQLFKLATY